MPKGVGYYKSKGGDNKFAAVMREFKAGKLRSGSKHGPKVKSPKQAKAIAMKSSRGY